MINCVIQKASLVSSNWSKCNGFLKDIISSMMINLIWEMSCWELLKCTANSHVLLLLSIFDLWLRNLILNSVDVEPTYCKLHLQHVAR